MALVMALYSYGARGDRVPLTSASLKLWPVSIWPCVVMVYTVMASGELLYSYGLYWHRRYRCGLYSYGLKQAPLELWPVSMRLYVVTACIAMASGELGSGRSVGPAKVHRAKSEFWGSGQLFGKCGPKDYSGVGTR